FLEIRAFRFGVNCGMEVNYVRRPDPFASCARSTGLRAGSAADSGRDDPRQRRAGASVGWEGK
ncbi:MAG TPA: hypothetical protein VMW16_04460, partial [Sedimentisphaerales bacterium]|nr:hypothetical protein [Sedimentisphaerales bacterium]